MNGPDIFIPILRLILPLDHTIATGVISMKKIKTTAIMIASLEKIPFFARKIMKLIKRGVCMPECGVRILTRSDFISLLVEVPRLMILNGYGNAFVKRDLIAVCVMKRTIMAC